MALKIPYRYQAETISIGGVVLIAYDEHLYKHSLKAISYN